MQNCCVLNESDFSYVDFIAQPTGIRELLLRLSKPGSATGILPFGYPFGSCDLLPLWYVAAAVSYIKESGDYGILEEIRLQDVFNSFCLLSGEFASLVVMAADGEKLCVEDMVTIGLFIVTCREYLRLCRLLDMGVEAAPAAVRLKWINCFYSDLFMQFDSYEWFSHINRQLYEKEKCGRVRGPVYLHGEISQYIRSGIFEILYEQDKGNAQNYWLATSSYWSRKETAEVIFGVKPDFHGLLVNPCMPDSFGIVQIKRHFRNAIYDIQIKNPLHKAFDIRKLVVDNAEYLGNLLPIFADGKTHKVEIIMGSFD